MSDYTPTTEEVREDYALGRNEVVGAGWYDEHRVEFDRWLAAHDAEKRAEWEAEQGETLTGEIRGPAFEDGEPHGIYCGLDECGCPDHDDPPRPAGTYITVRLDGEPPVGLWRVQVRRIPVPDTTNNESEGRHEPQGLRPPGELRSRLRAHRRG